MDLDDLASESESSQDMALKDVELTRSRAAKLDQERDTSLRQHGGKSHWSGTGTNALDMRKQ